MPTPSGIFGQAAWDFRTLLAAGDAFQAWVGAANPTAALNYIHFYEADDDLDQERYAVVGPIPAQQLERDTGAGGGGLAAFTYLWGCQFGLWERVDEFTDNAVATYLNNLHLIFKEVLENQGTATYTRVDVIEQIPWDDETFPLKARTGEELWLQAAFNERMEAR